MKRTIALLSAALMALSLTACNNGKDNNPNTSAPNQSATGSGAGASGASMVQNGNQRRVDQGATGTAATAADNEMLGLENYGAGAPGTVLNRGNNAAVQNGRTGGVTYGQMLRNGRVHDRDGYLLDGENAVTPGAAFR